MNHIQAVIFDLGGVLIDLRLDQADQNLRRYFGTSLQQLIDPHQPYPLFHAYETGQLNENDFLDALKTLAKQPFSRQEVLSLWNTILGDLPKHRLDCLLSLQTDYDVYLLSNTNYSHIQSIRAYLHTTYGIEQWENHFFKKAYYSYEMGLRKPDPRIYQHVLEDANLQPESTLFIDDMQANILSARQVGIQAVLLEKEVTELVAELFNPAVGNGRI